MPGWHDATRELRAAGRLGMVGILQEQHPDRARLFMQWQGMDWPLMVDALDLLGVAVVPITVLVDEHGVIRDRPRGIPSDDALRAFVDTDFPAPVDDHRPAVAVAPDLDALASAAATGDEGDLRGYAHAAFLWGTDAALDASIEAFESAVAHDPHHGPTHFRHGVALRARYDGPHRRPEDFQAAVDAWSRALAIDPNQYIWRRRIQQYGPRLAKPYPFYDWVDQARSELVTRGETPTTLRVEPGITERAAPTRVLDSLAQVEPDPDGRVMRGSEGLIAVEATTVPATIIAGDATRLHLTFRTVPARRGHWNNEAEDLTVWIDPPAGWQADRRRLTVDNPPEPVSDETRSIELELRSAADAEGEVAVRGYALYYACEEIDGTCIYRRLDFESSIVVGSTPRTTTP